MLYIKLLKLEGSVDTVGTVIEAISVLVDVDSRGGGR